MSLTKLVAVSREPVQDRIMEPDAPVSIRDLEPKILELYETGLQPGLATAWPSLTPYYTVKPGQVTVVTGIPHSGKALDITTLLPTPTGWTTMGEVKVGDFLFDDHGLPCRVLQTTDIMTDRPCYEIQFSDRTVIRCDAEHLWLTSTDQDRRSLRTARRKHRDVPRPLRSRGTDQTHKRTFPLVRTTREIAQSVSTHNANPRWQKLNHHIRRCDPVQYPEASLSVSPYVLGVWLGDGDSDGGRITTAEDEIVRFVEQAGYHVTKQASRYRYGVLGLSAQLRTLGVLKQKHIPSHYLMASIPQRWELLYGLMDTDGSCDVNGAVEFCNTNQILAQQVMQLAHSLGIGVTWRETRARLKGRDIGPCYRLALQPQVPVFRLSRKMARQRSRRRANVRMIVSCREIPSVPVRCIQVDSPSHLFLCGEGFIPTHNSPFVNQLALHCVVDHGWKVAWCSLEHLPYEDLSARLLEQFYKGLSFTHGAVMKMTRKDITQALDILKDRIFFLPPSEQDGTIPGVLERCQALVAAGLNGLIIDPYGEFEHKRPNGMTETEYVSQLLTQIRLFARRYQVHIWIVAHPTKIQKQENGLYPIVKPYDISGSAAWFNKPDCILSIYRDYLEPTLTQVHVQKCKFREVGKVGSITLRHDVITSLFQEVPEGPDDDKGCSRP